MSRRSRRGGGSALLDPLAPESEPIRILRTGVRFAGVDDPVRSVVISAAKAQIGKSTIAANLALSLAQVSGRTLLIDADLRRPTQSEHFRVSSRRGLTTALMRGGELAEHVISGTHEGLDLLPAGPLPPNPSELLSSPRMSTLMEQVRTKYDMVVVDGAPVLAATEAAVLASLVDGVIFVVDLKRSRRREVLEALDLLDRAGARVLGTCVNRHGRARRREAYY